MITSLGYVNEHQRKVDLSHVLVYACNMLASCEHLLNYACLLHSTTCLQTYSFVYSRHIRLNWLKNLTHKLQIMSECFTGVTAKTYRLIY